MKYLFEGVTALSRRRLFGVSARFGLALAAATSGLNALATPAAAIIHGCTGPCVFANLGQSGLSCCCGRDDDCFTYKCCCSFPGPSSCKAVYSALVCACQAC